MSYLDYLTEEDRELLKKSEEDGQYSPEYVEYKKVGDQHKPVKTYCMVCGAVIVDFEDPITLQAIRMGQEPENYRPIKYNLTDGSYLNVLVCPNCIDKVIDKNRVMAQIKAGLAREAELIGKDPEFIKQRAEHYNSLHFEEN